MWTAVRQRRHRAFKAFPGRFQAAGSGGPAEGEVMLYGDVTQWLKSAEAGADPLVIPWAAHLVVRKENDAWKLAQYRVWLQK